MINSNSNAEVSPKATRQQETHTPTQKQTSPKSLLLLGVFVCILAAGLAVPGLRAQTAFQFMPGDRPVRTPAYARVPAGYACYQRPAHYYYERGYPYYYPSIIYCVPPARQPQQSYAATISPYAGRPVASSQAPRPWGYATAAAPYPPQPGNGSRPSPVPAPYQSQYPGYASTYPQGATGRQPPASLPAASQVQDGTQRVAYAQATTASQVAAQADSATAVESTAVYRSPEVQPPVEPQPAATRAPQPKAASTEVSASDVIKGINTAATVTHSVEVLGSALDDIFDFLAELIGAAF